MSLIRRQQGKKQNRKKLPHNPRRSLFRPLAIERLEDRLVPATNVVGTSLPASMATLSSVIDAFTATFNNPLLATSAGSASNYSLVEGGKDGTFGDSDDMNYAVSPSLGSGGLVVSFVVQNG